MSRRIRAAGFLIAALVCAALAATIAGGYGASVADQLGSLRPVLVATEELPGRRVISAKAAATGIEVRRVPAKFAPAGALPDVSAAVGREPAVTIPAGGYLTSNVLRAPGPRRDRHAAALPEGASPVEIEVTGAGSLEAAGPTRVDVVVTTEPGPGARGRTFVAARAVPLLALAGAGHSDSASLSGLPTYVATLALNRAQALRLIDAESFARAVRLIEI